MHGMDDDEATGIAIAICAGALFAAFFLQGCVCVYADSQPRVSREPYHHSEQIDTTQENKSCPPK